jgi:hypothetical protein
VFLAGAKILDAVRPSPAPAAVAPHSAPRHRRLQPIRSRPRARPKRSGSVSPSSLRTD